MRTDYIDDERLQLILNLLTYENYLVCCVALQSGLRIDDCLALKTECLDKVRFTVREQKTGKSRKVRLSPELRNELKGLAGETFVFEGRNDPQKHRTRQAVYKDMRRACKALRISDNIRPHSLRKHYAVELFHRGESLGEIAKTMNHSSEFVTLLYALADNVELQATIRNRAKKG